MFRIDDGERFEVNEVYCEVERDGRVTELLLAGRVEW